MLTTSMTIIRLGFALITNLISLMGVRAFIGVIPMIFAVIRHLIPVIAEFSKALKDKRLSSDELEAIALKAGLALAEILKDLGLKHQEGK